VVSWNVKVDITVSVVTHMPAWVKSAEPLERNKAGRVASRTESCMCRLYRLEVLFPSRTWISRYRDAWK